MALEHLIYAAPDATEVIATWDAEPAEAAEVIANEEQKTGDIECDPPGRPYGNAQRFIQARHAHPERSLLIHQGGEWYRWSGTCWPAYDQGQLRAELYSHFERGIYVEGDKCKPFDPSRRKVDDLLDALRAVAYLDASTAVPSWLTTGHQQAPKANLSNAPADEVIACSNGLVHVPTRTLHPHTPTYYAHHAVPFEFVPEALATKHFFSGSPIRCCSIPHPSLLLTWTVPRTFSARRSTTVSTAQRSSRVPSVRPSRLLAARWMSRRIRTIFVPH